MTGTDTSPEEFIRLLVAAPDTLRVAGYAIMPLNSRFVVVHERQANQYIGTWDTLQEALDVLPLVHVAGPLLPVTTE